MSPNGAGNTDIYWEDNDFIIQELAYSEPNPHIEFNDTWMQYIGYHDGKKHDEFVMPEDKETVQLKKPDEVYLEIYKEVKRRAKEAKKRAIEAYLEAKRIKSLYLLDEIESSDDESELLEMTVN